MNQLVKQTTISESIKDYQPGDVIFKSNEPFVYVTKYEHRMFTCDHCMKSTNSSIVCNDCEKVYYCSTDCQQKSWDHLHCIECPILSRRKPMKFENDGIDYMQRLTLRLYLMLTKNNGEGLKYTFTLKHNPTLKRSIEEMETHSEELKDSKQFAGIVNYFKFYNINDYDEQLLLKCYGLLHVNSFGIDCYRIDDDNNKELIIEHRGCGFYLEASVFDHSCIPNACASGDQLSLEIRALRPIKRGEQIYIDYIQDVLPRAERQKHLKELYFFDCKCIGCYNSDDNNNELFDSRIDFKRFNVLENLIEKLYNEDSIHNDNSIKKLYELQKHLLTIQKQYYHRCQFHPCLSLFYYKFLIFLLKNYENLNEKIENFNIEEVVEILAETRKHLSITHGNEHRFYQWINMIATNLTQN